MELGSAAPSPLGMLFNYTRNMIYSCDDGVYHLQAWLDDELEMALEYKSHLWTAVLTI